MSGCSGKPPKAVFGEILHSKRYGSEVRPSPRAEPDDGKGLTAGGISLVGEHRSQGYHTACSDLGVPCIGAK